MALLEYQEWTSPTRNSEFDEASLFDDTEEQVKDMAFGGDVEFALAVQIDQLRDILPEKSSAELRAALQETNGNVAQAADLLLTRASSAVVQAHGAGHALFPEVVEVDADEVDGEGVALVQNAQAKATVVEREEAVDDVKDGSPALVVAYDGNLEACCGRMRGVYARHGSNHGKNLYIKLSSFGQEDKGRQKKRDAEAYVYFWDDRDGAENHGWWIGPDLGYTVWASNVRGYHDGSAFPPADGWNAYEYASTAPAPPPGAGWKAYQDDGRIWYYHESAKGKWWAHAGEEPKPYKEDRQYHRAASIRIQPYKATMGIMQAALPDCEPSFLQQCLGEKGDANEALEAIFASSTSYPRVAKRQRLAASSSSSFQMEAPTGGSSSSSSKPAIAHGAEDDKAEEENWFAAPGQRCKRGQYATEARQLLLNDFSMLCKQGIDSVFDKHQAYAPAWRELHEAWQAKERGEGLPKGLRERQAKTAKGRKRPSEQHLEHEGVKTRRLKQEVKFVRKWACKQHANETREARLSQCERDGLAIECECCFGKGLPDEVVQCSAGHLFCFQCVQRLVEIKLGEGEILKVMCPSTHGCQEALPPAELRRALPEALQGKLDKCMEESNIQALKQISGDGAKLEQCPFCDYVQMMDTTPEENKVFVCLNDDCGKESCRLCKEENHIPLRCSEVEKKSQTTHRVAVEERMSEALIRYCPPCKAKGINSAILKEDGCNKMTCPRSSCKAFFCYLCNQEIPRQVGYAHFCQHPATPGKPCTKCNKCLLWTTKDFDAKEAQRVVEAGRQFHQEYVSEHHDAELTQDLDILRVPERQQPRPSQALGLAPRPPPQRRHRPWWGNNWWHNARHM
mmetsp:Transcript_14661/g.32933  ORF Transcript_14661/g.32933 Transcript_14661/m.32933 type:complete len:851 (-) Transcript_14661:120-2672(-)